MEKTMIKTNELDSSIKTKVAIWKAQTGGTQCQLAKELGISPSFLSQILSGERPGKDYVAHIDRYTRIA